VARVGAREPVYVVDEPLGREQRLALDALYARRELFGVQFGHAHAPGLTEHVVEHFERERDHVLGHRGRGRRYPVEQREAQPLGVRLGHQAARRRRHRQYLAVLEHVQLLGRAPRTVDAQLVAHLVDLGEREVPEHRVEDLRQTEPHLAAHHEAGDLLPFQFRLEQLAPRLVRHVQHRVQGRRRWRRRRRRLPAAAAAGLGVTAGHRRLGRAHGHRGAGRFVKHRVGSLQAPGRAHLVRFQHFVYVRVVHLLIVLVVVFHLDRAGRVVCQ